MPPDLALLRSSRGRRQHANAAKMIHHRLFEFGRRRYLATVCSSRPTALAKPRPKIQDIFAPSPPSAYRGLPDGKSADAP